MKKAISLLLCLLLLFPAGAGLAEPAARPNSEAISHGTINKVTYLRWGKSELFPTLAMVGPGQEFDVYEYDKDWVMVLYETWVSQGMSGGSSQSFYCFVKRADITCDPELEGDESDKADTGPGKRKGKKPKPKPTAGSSAEATAPQASPDGSTEPEPSVEVDEEEYDWIIRTPGTCSVTVEYQQAVITCSFALMAQKAGGTAPSSDPAFNHNMHTPYAAMGVFQMVSPMASVLENMGVSSFLEGTGGVEIIGQTAGSKFYLDTGAMDPALVNFTINMQGQYTLNPKVTDGNLTGQLSMSGEMPFQLPVQLKKAGSGYQFVLKGMKPGGGDLTFPAVLEKAFADPDRWDKEAKEADRRRKEADRLLKELLEKIKKQTQDEYNKQQGGAGGDSETTGPMTVPGEDGEDIPLAPLVTDDPLAPLVSEEPLAPLVSEEPLAPLVTEDPLAPLTPTGDEEVHDFPSRQ